MSDMEDKIITSAANERVKAVKKLVNSSSERRRSESYVVEGIRMFRELPASDIISVYIAEGSRDKFADAVRDIPRDIVFYVKDSVFRTMSATDTPQGIMAVAAAGKYCLSDILDGVDKPFVLILDRIQDPGNMGTIIRTAEAAGVTGIIISSDSVDIYNPKAIRSTMGSIFRVKVYISENPSGDIDILKGRGITVYGAHLDGDMLYNVSFGSACAFLIGNEGRGLSADLADKADRLLKIPMEGKVESLNAAVSAAVISYEVMRQRKLNYFSSVARLLPPNR